MKKAYKIFEKIKKIWDTQTKEEKTFNSSSILNYILKDFNQEMRIYLITELNKYDELLNKQELEKTGIF